MKGMKPPSCRSLIWIGSCVASFLIVAGCKKTDASKTLPSEAGPSTRLDWNLKTLVDAYQKAGHTNPKWDEQARSALTEFARNRSRSTAPNEASRLIISNNCAAAVETGCDDPMVRYLYNRYCQTGSKQALADALCKGAQEMEQSSYPSIRKFYAWQRASQQIIVAYGYGTNIPPEVRRLPVWQDAQANLQATLSDLTMPPEEVYDCCHDFLDEWKGSPEHYDALYHAMEKGFPENWKKSPMMMLLKGEAYIEMAWHARGGGYANTVTSNGWKLFGQRLTVAEKALTNAWQLNPNEPRIAVKMITVELGQGLGRDRMDLWFHRAMALDPNDYDACNAKLWYLEPKWYGSVEDMLAFGRECVHNKQWGGHVPLILMDAHLAVQKDFTDDSSKAAYWKQPEFWLDLKNAFDRFFELNPEETSWYHNYAWYAYQAGQWDALNALISKLGPINYDYFGGKDKFETMVALAKEHAGETKAKDYSTTVRWTAYKSLKAIRPSSPGRIFWRMEDLLDDAAAAA
jgi:hypothetical protein